jgi:hypothetical protein
MDRLPEFFRPCVRDDEQRQYCQPRCGILSAALRTQSGR